jgi:NADH-quinone oxidoreductase subunit M
MNLLTTIGVLPLIAALVIAFLPKTNQELIKKVAFVATALIALASLLLATGFDRAQTGFQFTQSTS